LTKEIVHFSPCFAVSSKLRIRSSAVEEQKLEIWLTQPVKRFLLRNMGFLEDAQTLHTVLTPTHFQGLIALEVFFKWRSLDSPKRINKQSLIMGREVGRTDIDMH
jgi:hypothetical protein